MPKFKAGEGFPTGDIARISVFAALIAALGLPGTLNVFGNAVPIKLQSCWRRPSARTWSSWTSTCLSWMATKRPSCFGMHTIKCS